MRTCHLLMTAFSFAAVQFIIVPSALGQQTNSKSSPFLSGQVQSDPIALGAAVVDQNANEFGQNQRIRLVVGSSRVIKFDFDVPDVIVGSPDVLNVQPISANQIMVTGRRPGVSGLSVSDALGKQHTIDMLVIGDTRQLQITLAELFPRTTIRAFALNTNVVLTGHVQKISQIKQAEDVAKDFFPNGVRNMLTIGGPSKIALECKVVEVSRTKLRDIGIDWSLATSGFAIQNSASALLDDGTGTGNFFFRIIDGTDQFPLFLNLLRQNNLAKILTQPTIVTIPGRPASLLNGGLIPIPINTGLGVQSVEYKEFGTKLDVLPIMEGDGQIRVEVRAEVTDVAFDLAVGGTPGFRSRNVDTAVQLREGQTLALAGLIQNRTDSTSTGIPGLKDMPWIGSLFRRVQDTFNEVELIILVTPRFISEVDPASIGRLPGRETVAPCDYDFFLRGYQEVPRTGNSFELGPMQKSGFPAIPTYTEPQPQGAAFDQSETSNLKTGSSTPAVPSLQNSPNDNNISTNQNESGLLKPFPSSEAELNGQSKSNNDPSAPKVAIVPMRSPYSNPLPNSQFLK